MSPEIASIVVYNFTAKETWTNLKNRFTKTNGPRLYQLRKDIISLQQGTKTIIEYFTKFRGFKDELHNLVAIPKCICGSAKTQEQADHNQSLT